jgi:hypothetical protein
MNKEDLREIVHSGKEDFKAANLRGKLMLGGLATGLCFEWGTGNEALLGMVGGHFFQATHDALLTAAVAGSASFTEQAILGAITAVNISNFPKLMKRLNSKFMKNDSQNEPYAEPVEQPHTVPLDEIEVTDEQIAAGKKIQLMGRFITAFALGTSVKALADNARETKPLRANLKNTVGDAGLIAGGVAGIVGFAAGATNLGRSFGLESYANDFVSIITHWETYAGLFGMKLLNDRRKAYKAKREMARVG